MRQKVEEVIGKLRPALAGTDVVLLDVSGRVVKLQVFASGCHGGPPKEAAVAILEEELTEEIPGIQVIVVD